MQIINTNNLNQARKQIQELKKQNKKPMIVQSQDDAFNRKILENKDIDILLAPESHNRKDYMKQRDSGLNEVLCKLATKNNITIAIDLNNLKKQEKKQKAIILARIKQNIQLCKRTKTKIILLPNPSKQEAISFMQTLGSSTNQAKQAIE
jgi:RNase P/RNase MRP subunit p30